MSIAKPPPSGAGDAALSTPAAESAGIGATTGPDRADSLARNRLSTLSICGLVVSAVAPVSVLAAGAPVVFAVGGASAPAIYIVAGVLFGIFAAGYVAMSRQMVNAGGFVAYVARALGNRVASATAFVTLLFYLASLIAFCAIVGVAVAGTFSWNVSTQLVTFTGLALVGILGFFGISISPDQRVRGESHLQAPRAAHPP